MKHLQKLIIVLSLLITTTLFARINPIDKSNYALLWEVTGNGLAKPSYLFGTIHTRNPKAFELPDSVLIALQNTSAFAAEFSIDSLTFLLQEEVEELEQFQLSITNLVWYKNVMHRYGKGEGEAVFLDGYLYRLARQMGLKRIGLESFDEADRYIQRAMEQGVSPFSQGRLTEKSLIETYQKGDLKAIGEDLNYYDKTYKKIILEDRNDVMVKRLLRLMHQKPVFCAVGAAHLPTSFGIINLLKARGYKVRKVTATFTNYIEDYKEDPTIHQWSNLEDLTNQYSINFPNKPFQFNELKETAISSCVDVTGLTHFSTVKEIPLHLNLIPPDSIPIVYYNSLRLRGTSKTAIEKCRSSTGDIGYAFYFRSDYRKKVLRLQMYVKNQRLYLIGVMDHQFDTSHSFYVNKFFRSFKIGATPQKPIVVHQRNQALKDEDAAFIVDVKGTIVKKSMPSNLFNFKSTPSSSYQYTINNKSDNQYFTIACLNKISFFDMKEEVESAAYTLNYPIEQLDKITYQGFEGRDLILKVSATQQIQMRYIQRGQRMYALSAKYDIQDKKTVQQFFDSFTFLPYKTTHLIKNTTAFRNAIIYLPNAKEEKRTRGFYNKAVQYQKTYVDDATGVIYKAVKLSFNPHTYAPDLKVFLYENIKKWIGESAKITQTSFNDATNLKSLYAWVTFKDKAYKTAIQLFICGKDAYLLEVNYPLDFNKQQQLNQFFERFKPNTPCSPHAFGVIEDKQFLKDYASELARTN